LRAFDQRLDTLDEFVPGVDIDSRIAIGESSGLLGRLSHGHQGGKKSV
jgi:hypothetical protein